MPYPISIKKQVTIDLDGDSIKSELSKELSKIRANAEFIDSKVKMTWCIEFSSRATSLKEFNRGHIALDSTSERTKVNIRIVLIEHLVIFLLLVSLGLYGLFDSGLDSVMVKIAAILLIANFVFCYLFPLMSLNSFVRNLNKWTRNK